MEPDDVQFETVRRLLAWKRHETPPPGFFARFPDRVRARLETPPLPVWRVWWERLRPAGRWRSALAGGCALAACGLLAWQFAGARGRSSGSPDSSLSATPGSSLPRWEMASPPVGLDRPSVAGLRPAGSTPHLGTSEFGSLAPRGLFAPGAGLQGHLVPASATGMPASITVTGYSTGGVHLWR